MPAVITGPVPPPPLPATQLTWTSATGADAVPLPLLTVHDWPAGWVLTSTR